MRALTPALRFPPELLLLAQGPGGEGCSGIRAAIFDVDGVLTDGRLHVGEHGEQIKVFHTLDGHGLKLLARHGIEPVIVSGRDAPALRRRAAELGITHLHTGVADKLVAGQAVLDALGLDWPQIAVIGDDWPDLPLMARAGFACAPPQAHAEARAAAHYVTQAPAGHGAAREFCDLLLMAAGHYRRAFDDALRTGAT